MSHVITADEWIERLRLVPHPEGGYFRETYRAAERLDRSGVDRAASTAIYFLLKRGQISALHRIASDEVWHFYAGAKLLVSAILPEGDRAEWTLGVDPSGGALPQCVVPAGAWFGAEVVGETPDYALVGCTVAPGFEFVDFELADRLDLLSSYPRHAPLITRLTR